jgi:release factor glutamine methyltransferase
VDDDLVARLRAAGCLFAEEEAALLRGSAAPGPALEALVTRRVAGEPLEQLLGLVAFAGLRVPVRPGLFVPRRRTELLAEQAAALAPSAGVVAELCCGVAAVSLAVLAAHPEVELHAADLDPAAVSCARANLAGRGAVHQGDLYDALPGALAGRVDVVVANAPYVPTAAIALMPPEAREHEARLALDGGSDGLAVLRRVLAGAPDWLRPGGAVLVECSERQTGPLGAVAAEHGLSPQVVADDDRGATVVVASRG